MHITVERLRLWLVVCAGALLLLIAGFLGYSHYRINRFFNRLPQQLGVDIQQSTDGFTYSQSVKGKTLFTVHAAKAIQRKDGKLTLHDVRIVVHEQSGSREDRISSKEFVYDQKLGVIQADGEVHLDLQAPAGGKESADEGAVHVKTSGLVFLQKLGVAATENPIEFEAKGINGHAKGADYSTDTGLLILHSAVDAVADVRGNKVQMWASWAQLDRQAQVANLKQLRVVQGGDVAEVAQATVHLRRDGSAERVETAGGLKLTQADGGLVTAQRGEARLDAKSHPEFARLVGAVHFEDRDATRQADGDAGEATMEFAPGGLLKTGHMNGSVKVHETEGKNGGKKATRDLGAEKVDLQFTQAGKKAELREVRAQGNASFAALDEGKQSRFAGNVLIAQIAKGSKGLHVTSVHGDGHTVSEIVTAKGVRQTSVAERMDVQMNPAGSEINNGTLAGGVVITQTDTQKGKLRELRAEGERAEMHPDGMVTLTGRPRVDNGEATLEAERIEMQRETKQAWAYGSVKASYARAAGDPLHLIAEKAEWRTDETAVFTGTSKPVRMWQSQSQVEAPTVTLDRARQVAVADAGLSGRVRAVLVSAAREKKPASVYRILSRKMTYNEAARQIDFSGPVQVESADGRISAGGAVVTMASSKESKDKKQGEFGGNVERVVARDNVVVEQGQRRGTGDLLVYTAADGMAVLTGTASAPPVVSDPVQGTVTGASLSFHAGDDSVVVSGANGRRVRTETQVKKN